MGEFLSHGCQIVHAGRRGISGAPEDAKDKVPVVVAVTKKSGRVSIDVISYKVNMSGAFNLSDLY